MKQVTFTRDMRPYLAGGKLLVADDVAANLLADGAVNAVVDWPEKPDATEPAEKPSVESRRRSRRANELPLQAYGTK